MRPPSGQCRASGGKVKGTADNFKIISKIIDTFPASTMTFQVPRGTVDPYCTIQPAPSAAALLKKEYFQTFNVVTTAFASTPICIYCWRRGPARANPAGVQRRNAPEARQRRLTARQILL